MTNQERALKYVSAFKEAGHAVRRVIIDGKRVEVELAPEQMHNGLDLMSFKVET